MTGTAAAYERKLSNDAAGEIRRWASARDIAEGYEDWQPTDEDLELRAACKDDLGRFFKDFFPEVFRMGWSADHLRIIDRIQSTVIDGGMLAMAMPRGSGKTSMTERAAIWALLYSHRKFVCVVGATAREAEKILDSIKSELMHNERLHRPFRSVCYPIAKLENQARRCGGQTFRSKPTQIRWAADEVVFPNLPDEVIAEDPDIDARASIVTVRPLTGAIRGQKHTQPSGRQIRPDMVLLDDPQTRDTARSPSQNAERIDILNGDVMYLNGPGQPIAAMMPCTVIKPGDMADTILDREQHPHWRGERCKAVYAWPKFEAMWEEYRVLMDEEMRLKGTTKKANAFYKKHRASMDEGSRVAWEERHEPNELSAIQHCMNLRYKNGDEAFFAEFQNEPLIAEDESVKVMTPDEISNKLNGITRRRVPAEAEIITAFIDVQQEMLFYAVIAWRKDAFSGWVIDYSTWPDQKVGRFSYRAAKKPLSKLYKGAGIDGALLSGLNDLESHLHALDLRQEDGTARHIDWIGKDAGYKQTLVMDQCRRSPRSDRTIPAKGTGIGAKNVPFEEQKKNRGDRVGWGWKIPKRAGGRTTQLFLHDTNHWKSFTHERLAIALGDPGSLSFWGNKPHVHGLMSEHLTAEVPTRVTAKGRTVDEWSLPPSKPDNHWLDCVCGCAAGASMLGAQLPGSGASAIGTTARKRYSL